MWQILIKNRILFMGEYQEYDEFCKGEAWIVTDYQFESASVGPPNFSWLSLLNGGLMAIVSIVVILAALRVFHNYFIKKCRKREDEKRKHGKREKRLYDIVVNEYDSEINPMIDGI